MSKVRKFWLSQWAEHETHLEQRWQLPKKALRKGEVWLPQPPQGTLQEENKAPSMPAQNIAKCFIFPKLE